MWHASIAYLNRKGATPLVKWGDGTHRRAYALGLKTLEGVGKEPTIPLAGEFAAHFRRSLTESEMEMLSAEWLAIPARDNFTYDGKVEIRL